KLANRAFFQASNPSGIQAQIKDSNTPVGHLVAGSVHIAVLLGVVIAFAELAVGLGTLFGLFSRVAALGGMLLALSFFLTVSYNDNPYYYGPDIVFVFAWTPLVIGGAGALSFDGVFARMKARELAEASATTAGADEVVATGVARRVAVAKMATGMLIAGFTLFCGGVSAAAGRVFAKSGGNGEAGVPTIGGSTTTVKGAGGTTSSTGTTPPSVSKGKLLAATSAVPVGAAAGFTDPFTGGPAYCVQPKAGDFLGFSAICTHEGCTVQFVKSVEEFQCPCHGSRYSAATGAVLQGPAVAALPSIEIKVADGNLYVLD
ncbi:MAG TPA: Rieske 2Fe-2S domain-containing protein, partial [Acidimicrobiales bacterium]|nr:Rieske 2Fe-2S domain-containing protein [Acidimicrobiales bacterium]